MVASDTVTQQRFYVGNLPKDCSTNDLSLLFQKICPKIEDVYLPKPSITGIERNFAIVVALADEETVNKVIKSLNLCFWKGKKIHISQCKSQYYKTKLDNERLLLKNHGVENNEKEPLTVNFNHENVNFIKLKNKYSIMNVSLIPIVTDKPNDFVSDMICCKRKVFEYDSSDNLISSDDFLEISETKVSLDHDHKPKRRGFGNISINSLNEDKSTNCCIDNTITDNNEMKCEDEDVFPNSPINIQDLWVSDNYSSNTDKSLKLEKNKYFQIINEISTETTNDKRDNSNKHDFSKISTSSLFVKRYDPKKNQSIKYDQKPNIVEINKSSDIVSFEDSADPTGNSNDNNKIENIDEIDAIDKHNEKIDSNDFTDLNQLKNIFYKEGGVWWGDDGTLKQQVHKGNVTEDQLFLEAERLGIDIRSSKSDSQMVFNFFDEDHPTIENQQNNIMSSENKVIIDSTFNPPVSLKELNNSVVDTNLDLYNKIMSFSFIVNELTGFKSNSSDDELNETWQQQREKLRTAFKKNKKEANKKRNNRNQLNYKVN